MDAGPGTELGGLGWFAVVWVTMMAAMMLPSIAPMVLAHARVQIGATPAFVAGYLLTWAAVGILGWALVEGVRSLDLGVLAWDEAGPYVAGGAILAAAIYQLSPLKQRSLRRCRNPRAFVSEHWRPGRVGALRMGIEHGRVCVGSSWALMAALFALGVMSVGWMVLVAALIAAEKLLPWRTVATRGIAVLLAVLAVAVAFSPENVPGLTIPSSPAERWSAWGRIRWSRRAPMPTEDRHRGHALAPMASSDAPKRGLVIWTAFLQLQRRTAPALSAGDPGLCVFELVEAADHHVARRHPREHVHGLRDPVHVGGEGKPLPGRVVSKPRGEARLNVLGYRGGFKAVEISQREQQA